VARIFVSYNRQSQEITKSLVSDLAALGHAVWFDQELSGGQPWWERILAAVRDCDVFVFVMDQRSLNSAACHSEFDYAARLGKPILPVLVGEGVAVNLMPRELSLIQFVDYRRPDRQSAFGLARALNTLPPARPLPVPLPEPPEVPASYLGGLAQRVDTAPSLTYEEQSAVLVDLRRGLRDTETTTDARALLEKLRQRRDLFAAVAEEIDELLRIQPVESAAPPPAARVASSARSGQSLRPRFLAFLLAAMAGAIFGGIGALFDQTAIDDGVPPFLMAALTFGIVGVLAGSNGRLIRYALIGLATGGLLGGLAVGGTEEFLQIGAMYTGPAIATLAVIFGIIQEKTANQPHT
jgi:hypothetical protein